MKSTDPADPSRRTREAMRARNRVQAQSLPQRETEGAPPQSREVRTDGASPLGGGLPRHKYFLNTAKRATYSILVNSAAPTARLRMLPGFLITGAQRCGTTSMSYALRQHPALFSAVFREEVHYFDVAYHRGLAWYRCHFPLAARARLSAGRHGTVPIAFESSPYYMFHPLAAERIAHDLPTIKLIVLIRDPVERAYSGHAHEVAHGYESESFERALELEEARLEGEVGRILARPSYYSYSHQHHSYRARGQYIEQLENLEKFFGRKQIHIVDSGEFFADPGPTYAAVLEFLELPPARQPAFEARNARPRPAPMPGSVRKALQEHYRPYDERLAKWLGRDPSWWR